MSSVSYDKLEFEQLLLGFLVKDADFRAVVLPVLEKKMFQLPNDDIIFEHIQAMFFANDPVVSLEKVWLEIRKAHGDDQKKMNAILDLFEKLDTLEDDFKQKVDREYMIKSTEQWAMNRALEGAVFESVKLIESRKGGSSLSALPDIFTKALSISVGKKDGVDYLDSFDEWWSDLHDSKDKIPFSIPKLNFVTENGFARKTLNVLIAATGKGKSAAMLSLACDYIRQGLNVLYVTLELSEHQITSRANANILDVELSALKHLDRETLKTKWLEFLKKKPGKFKIQEFPTSQITTLQIRTLLKDLKQREGFVPDVMFVDYINLLNPARALKGAQSYYTVKATAEELRGIAVENNLICVTATQTTRAGIDADDLSLSDTSESIGLPFTVDFMLAMYQSDDQRDSNMLMCKVLKTRYSSYLNYKFALQMDFSRMRLSAFPEAEELALDKGFRPSRLQTRRTDEPADVTDDSASAPKKIEINRPWRR